MGYTPMQYGLKWELVLCTAVWTTLQAQQCSLVLVTALHPERTMFQLFGLSATAIATALSPAASNSSTPIVSNSPAKVIESYKQLKQSGVLTDEEYRE